MQIVLLSDSKKNIKWFNNLKLPGDFTLLCVPVRERKKYMTGTGNTFIYLDVSAMDEKEMMRIIRQLAKCKSAAFGVIDEKNYITDIASLFHLGASDYINRPLIRAGLTAKRIREAVAFKPHEGERRETGHESGSGYILSGKNWDTVRSGKEYTFSFMYLELDNGRTMKQDMGKDLFTVFTTKFREILEQHIAPHNGKIWIWNEYNGLILFPFDGKSCEALLPSLRLMLNRSLICIEHFNDMPFTWKTALHIGNTVYRARGNTGGIISDSLNSIFHLGQKFTAEGCLYVTDEALRHFPEGPAGYFVQAGTFEKRKIYRMKHL